MPLSSLLFFDLLYLFFISQTNHTDQVIEDQANAFRLCQHHPSRQHQSNPPHCLTSLYNHPQPTTSSHSLHQVQTNLHTHYFPKYQTTHTLTLHNKQWLHSNSQSPAPQSTTPPWSAATATKCASSKEKANSTFLPALCRLKVEDSCMSLPAICRQREGVSCMFPPALFNAVKTRR
ncbi:hypothetical protein AUEXF2481DRAFT_606856 [Aureobasidium subglaciale EXF-2481]|uniref:Uncharacterized protein n=1 Tax=Aureobasidium subglaciale (strain EXF-2481) TaxID=1043005 RepID=A0A074XX96_AURSE|nr:uncharacterized protein AUEXF2481DRAFT_606856 [Aureobasidium subglaciale EXF-2481]KEQ90188.1 hypothetical protein AUEXF2481DRAFT_606856 [Aureobasidium subglaciale EXF-2481]